VAGFGLKFDASSDKNDDYRLPGVSKRFQDALGIGCLKTRLKSRCLKTVSRRFGVSGPEILNRMLFGIWTLRVLICYQRGNTLCVRVGPKQIEKDKNFQSFLLI
jgi:hypothetical protein